MPRPIAHKRPDRVRAVPLASESAYTWRVSVAVPAGRPLSPAAAVLLRQAQLTVTLATEQTVVGAGR